MGITQTIIDCHRNWTPYEKWETKNRERYAKKQYLFNNFNELNPTELKQLKQKSNVLIRNVNILDNASENAAENMQLATQQASSIFLVPIILVFEGLLLKNIFKAATIAQKTKKIPSSVYVLPCIAIAPALLNFPITLWQTKKQIEASRVARMKAREEELKDVRNFVLYTPEQVELAKKIAKGYKDSDIDDEDKKNISVKSAFKSIINADSEYSKYLKMTKEKAGIDKKIAQKVNETYSDKELLQGQKDKELILTGVKEINNNAERYCENVEAAFNTLSVFNFLLVLPSMAILNKLLNVIPNKISKSNKSLISTFLPIAVLFPLNLYYTQKQKEAAKVGRYKAKQELSQDLSKLAYFNDEQLKKAEHIKPTQTKPSVFQKIKHDFKFLSQYLKDREEFLNYKKTDWIKDEKLQKALKTVPITNEQKKEAEKLQQKVFFVFDELDEMSQKYSEYMEGGIGVAKNILGTLKSMLLYGSLMLSMYCLIRGKLPIAKLVNTLSNIVFKKEAPIRKNVNEIYNKAKNDKKLNKMISQACAFEDNKFKELMSEPKIAPQRQNLLEMLGKLKEKGFIKSQLKDTKLAKWGLNLLNDLSQIGLNKLSAVPKEQLSALKLEKIVENAKNNKSDFKTLKWTLIGIGAPLVAGVLGLSYIFNSWLAHLQKKAGFIGVMNSINNLDNVKYFATKEN